MLYVFDTNCFVVASGYYPARFPSFWEHFDASVAEGLVLSVREVRNELERILSASWLLDWVQERPFLFPAPSSDEAAFVAEIFAVPHFQSLVGERQRLKGSPVADPFLVASAKIRGGCVVTEEKRKPNAARIPNVCDHFDVPCTNLEGFMERNDWSF